MDIKAKIDEIVAKIQSDKTFGEDFKKDPIKAVEKVLGIDLPDDQIKAIIEGVKAKINLDDLGEKAQEALGALKGMFGKK